MNAKNKNLRLLSLVAVLFAVLILAGSAYAKDITEMIPKNASGVLIIDYAKNGFGDKVLKFFDKVATADDKKATEALKNRMGFSFNDPVFLSTISKVAVVYLDEVSKGPITSTNVPVAFIIQLAKKEAFMTHLSNMKASVSKSGAYNLYAKKDQPQIEVLEDPKNKAEYFAFTTSEDFFVAGTGYDTAFDALNKVLETAKDAKLSIKESENFNGALKVFPMDQPVYFYLDGSYIAKFSAEEKIMSDLNFIKSFCYSVGVEGTKIIKNGVLITDKTAAGNAFAKYFTKEGSALTAPAMLDNETVLYLGGKFNFDAKTVAEDKKLAESKAQIAAKLGVDFDKEIVPWIGDEFFISVSNYKIIPLPVLPAPGIYFGLKAKDKDACMKCMSKIMAALKQPFKETKTGDVTIFHSPVPTPGNIIPDFGITFAFVNDFIIMTTSKDAAASLTVVLQKKESSLALSKPFVESIGTLAKTSLFTFFYNGVSGGELLSGLAKLSGEANKLSEKELDILKIANSFGGGFTYNDACLFCRAVVDINKDVLLKSVIGMVKDASATGKPAEEKAKSEEKK